MGNHDVDLVSVCKSQYKQCMVITAHLHILYQAQCQSPFKVYLCVVELKTHLRCIYVLLN